MTTKTAHPAAPNRIEPDEKLKLWVRSGGRCALCNKFLLEHEATALPIPTGEMAHNVGRSTSSRSPRGDNPLPLDARNVAENLLLLCPEDHLVIDSKVGREEFPVHRLRAIKRSHEERIHRLTELTDDDRTVVIRLTGDVRGAAPATDAQTIRLAVATDGKYPRYELGAASASDVEIDLRRIPAEGHAPYWQVAEQAITDVIVRQLGDAIDRGLVHHVSVFAFARIPALVLLGHHLDDKTPATIYQFAEGAWGWLADEHETVEFIVERVTGRAGDEHVTVLLSVSASIDLGRVPAEITRGAVYELRPATGTPNRDLLRSAASLRSFAAAWRTLLSQIEHEHRGRPVINVVPAVPLSAAVEIGRNRTREAHPRLVVWDRDGETYTPTVEIKR